MLTAALDELERAGRRPGDDRRGLGARCLRAAAGGPGDGRVGDGSTPWSHSVRSSGGTPATTTSSPASAPRGLQRVQLDTGLPVVFGVLTTDTVEQALVRSLPDETNKGAEAARTAVDDGGGPAGPRGTVRPGRVGFTVGGR